MIEFLIDNICVMFVGRVFQQSAVPTVLLFSPTCFFIVRDGLHKKNEKELTRPFNFTFRYTDDVLSLNNSNLVILLIASIPLRMK